MLTGWRIEGMVGPEGSRYSKLNPSDREKCNVCPLPGTHARPKKRSFIMRTVKSILLVSLCLAAATANAQLPLDPDELSQINMCAQPGGSGVNLIGCSLKFNSLGEITFTVKNRGDKGINTATGPADLNQQPGRKAPTGPPIEFNLYLQDKLIVTLYQPALGAGQSRTFTAKVPSNYATMIPKCAEARALKLHIDPKNQVAEATESDNILLRAAAKRPCPDLAIKSIRKIEQGLL